MQGLYKIYADGKIIEERNIITNAGKNLALNVMAGKAQSFINSIVVGIGDQAATVNDTNLQFMVGSASVTTTLVDPVNEKIYYKATLPDIDYYLISEIGCIANNNFVETNSGILFNFNGLATWTSTGTWSLQSANSRIDMNSISYSMNNENILGSADFQTDMSLLDNNCGITFAYYTNGISGLTLGFLVDNDNYFYFNSWPTNNGYHVAKINKSDFLVHGAPNWNAIKTISVASGSTGVATLSLDAVRYDSPMQSTNLLSRAVLSTPKQKLGGIQMDIEYVLDVNI